MKAIMQHDVAMSIIHFKVEELNLIYAIPNKLKCITEISDYEDGFITMQTNCGEEYTDLIELVSNSSFSDSIKRRYENVFNLLELNDIKLERC